LAIRATGSTESAGCRQDQFPLRHRWNVTSENASVGDTYRSPTRRDPDRVRTVGNLRYPNCSPLTVSRTRIASCRSDQESQHLMSRRGTSCRCRNVSPVWPAALHLLSAQHEPAWCSTRLPPGLPRAGIQGSGILHCLTLEERPVSDVCRPERRCGVQQDGRPAALASSTSMAQGVALSTLPPASRMVES